MTFYGPSLHERRSRSGDFKDLCSPAGLVARIDFPVAANSNWDEGELMPVSNSEVVLWRTYTLNSGEIAIPTREWTDENGNAWIEATFTRGSNIEVEQHPKTEFLEIIHRL
jgi:hypothetical protein